MDLGAGVRRALRAALSQALAVGGQPALAANLRESVARVYAALGMSPQAAGEFGKVADFRARQSGEAAPAALEQARAQLRLQLGNTP